MKGEKKYLNLLSIFLVYISWIIITELIPYIKHIYDFHKINRWILPAIRMTLMLLVTFFYARFYEKRSFTSGFNFSFQKIGKNIFWAVIFFVGTGIFVLAYQAFIVKPLTKKFVIASSGISREVARPFIERLIEYLYIVYEGIIEVLIFIGFLLDRLARKWGWTAAIIVSNVAFAFWHFHYWRSGWLNGSLMIILTFLIGVGTSLCYAKTKNSMGPVLLHTMMDSPMSIRILLGMM